jgi:hypothetical protein
MCGSELEVLNDVISAQRKGTFFMEVAVFSLGGYLFGRR